MIQVAAAQASPLPQKLSGPRVSVTTPSYGPDWVLVVDDAQAGYAGPGLLLSRSGSGRV